MTSAMKAVGRVRIVQRLETELPLGYVRRIIEAKYAFCCDHHAAAVRAHQPF